MPLPPNFSFVWNNRVAGSAHPGTGQELMTTLGSLREVGIGAILSLTEEPLDFAPIREQEIHYLHLAVDDFTAPNPQQVQEAVDFLNEQVEMGHGALVHCRAGIGRTGTILACFLVGRGIDAKEAIRQLRQLRPHSMEVYSQEFCVYQFAKSLHRENQPEGE